MSDRVGRVRALFNARLLPFVLGLTGFIGILLVLRVAFDHPPDVSPEFYLTGFLVYGLSIAAGLALAWSSRRGYRNFAAVINLLFAFQLSWGRWLYYLAIGPVAALRFGEGRPVLRLDFSWGAAVSADLGSGLHWIAFDLLRIGLALYLLLGRFPTEEYQA